jgi:uncharacterized protein (TIGR02246 family)
MTTEKGDAADEAQIRQLIHDWVEAIRAKDVDGVMSRYAPEIVSFNLAPPLRVRVGADEYRKFLKEWFATFEASINYEISELEITVGGDAAFAHSINRFGGKKRTGEENDMWVRSTVGFRKIDGNWLVTHEHSSVPFYMDGSHKAAIDLKP